MGNENPYKFTMPDQQEAFSGSVEFKSLFTTMITHSLGWGIPTGVSIILICEGVDTIDLLVLIASLAGAALFDLGVTAILVAYYKVYVRIDRLRGYNAMGKYFDLPWADIEAIRPINFGGLRYIRISSKKTSGSC